MTEALHFPRLATQGVRLILQNSATFSQDWQDRRAIASKWVSFASTGGRRLSDAEIGELREAVIEIAQRNGFPGDVAQRELSAFDFELTVCLVDRDLVAGPEAFRDDVWAFLASILLPDVVQWRFGSTADRYRGGVRNTFQRLWLRGTTFQVAGEDRWEIVRTLSEDANVQILERPSLSGSRRVAKAIGEEWLALSRRPIGSALEAVMRRTAVTLRITNQVLYLDALEDEPLRQEIARHFQRAIGT